MNLLNKLLQNAEYVALAINILMFLAFLSTGSWPKAVYWAGTVLIVIGVIWMAKA